MRDVRVSAVPCADGLQLQRVIDRDREGVSSAAVADERRDGREWSRLHQSEGIITKITKINVTERVSMYSC
jgi:hypothetical protein